VNHRHLGPVWFVLLGLVVVFRLVLIVKVVRVKVVRASQDGETSSVNATCPCYSVFSLLNKDVVL
jgi:hypothetical protein